MYLLIVSYTQPPAQVEPHIPTHGAWVRQHLAAGDFLFAGPKKSGLGGVIGARSMDKAALQAILAADSYVVADVADYQVVEFDNRLAAPGLEALNAP
jgi:uncharacterized protein YciI